MNRVKLAPEYFSNPSIGRAESGAQIYVGTVDLDPEVLANQIQLSVQQENGTIVAVSQPILTGAGGRPVYNGSTVTLLVDGNYSLKVLSSTGSQIYYVPNQVDYVTPTQSLLFVNSLFALINLTSFSDGDAVVVFGFFFTAPESDPKGGGKFVWQSGVNKNLADGGKIIDPGTTGGFDGTVATRDAFLSAQGTGVGNGCWVATDDNPLSLNPITFGGLGDGVTDDTKAVQAYVATLADGDVFTLPVGDWLVSETITIAVEVDINMLGTLVSSVSNLPAIDVTSNIRNKNLALRIVRATPSDWAVDTSSGIRFTGIVACNKIAIFDIRDFYRGVFFDYNSVNYAAWNTIAVKRINNCKRGVEIYLQNSAAWFNENVFEAFYSRADSTNNPTEDFYGIYAHATGYYSFNRNVLQYPSFEGTRMVGLHAEKTAGWLVEYPRNENIGTGKSIQLVNCNESTLPVRYDSIKGIPPDLVDISFTADYSNQASLTDPISAVNFNDVPVFSLSQLEVDTTANTLYPLVRAVPGGGDADPTFTYGAGLVAGDAAAYVKANGGYDYTYGVNPGYVGALIDLQGASLITVAAIGTSIRTRLIFLDAAKALIFNAAGDAELHGETFVANGVAWIANYGYLRSANITDSPFTVWVNPATVKFIVVHPGAQTSFIDKFDIYTNNKMSHLVSA